MVFGWGKKKKKKPEVSTQEEKDINLDDISKTIEDTRSLRTKTIIAEVKSFRKRIESKLNEISKIIKELEKDDLKVDDIDKHLEILVVRGKKQVIETVKRENSEKLPDVKSYDDVIRLNTILSQRLKKIGDVLGRQSRVIHIFAKKYASKLKDHLSVLNSDRAEMQTMIDKHTQLNNDISKINTKLSEYNNLKNQLEEKKSHISELQNSIENLDNTLEDAKNSILELKASDEFAKYQETQKKLDTLSSEKNQIKNRIDTQFTKISRSLGRYEYVSSLEKPQKALLDTLNTNPFDALGPSTKNDVIQILSSVRKGVEGGSISVKDSEKSLSGIDETIEMLDGFISDISEFSKKKESLEHELASFDKKALEEKENQLFKIKQDKDSTEATITRLEKEISEIQKNLPRLLVDLQQKLRRVSSVKYHIVE